MVTGAEASATPAVSSRQADATSASAATQPPPGFGCDLWLRKESVTGQLRDTQRGPSGRLGKERLPHRVVCTEEVWKAQARVTRYAEVLRVTLRVPWQAQQ